MLFVGLEINCHRLYRMEKYLDHSPLKEFLKEYFRIAAKKQSFFF